MTTLDRSLQAGSMTWRLTKLEVGDYITEPEKGDYSRCFCTRSIQRAREHAPGSDYVLMLCIGAQHDGKGDAFRFFRMTRLT